MDKTPKEVFQEIMEDKEVDPAVRLNAANQLRQVVVQEEYKAATAGMMFDSFGEPIGVSPEYEERLKKLEGEVSEALEVFRHLRDS